MDEQLMKMHLEHARMGACTGDYFVDPTKEIRDLTQLQLLSANYSSIYLPMYEVLYADQEDEALDIYLPQTVIYRFNRPMAWYRSTRHRVKAKDSRSRQSAKYKILKKRQSSLKNALILHSFLTCSGGYLDENDLYEDEDPELVISLAKRANGNKKLPFVAIFVSSEGIRYFTEKELQPFLLLSKEKIDGILQEFVAPGGGVANTMIQPNCDMIRCVWTPSVTYVERRRNAFTLYGSTLRDKGKDPVARVETFDGVNHTQSAEAPVTSAKDLGTFHNQASAVAGHFRRVTTGRMALLGGVFSFKLLPNADLIFMWVDSVKLANCSVPHNLLASAHEASAQQPGGSPLVPEVVSSETVHGMDLPPPTEVIVQRPIIKPIGTTGISVEVRHRQHSSVVEKGRMTCRLCRQVSPKDDFSTLTYHTLMAALGNVVWSVDSNIGARRRRAANFSLFALDEQKKDLKQEAKPKDVTLTTKFSFVHRQMATIVRHTESKKDKKKRGDVPVGSYTAEEAWRYEPFTTESFQRDPRKEFGRHASFSLNRSYDGSRGTIPWFIRKLHPYITVEQYEELRVRNDFLATEALLCTQCVCQMTEGLASDFQTGSTDLKAVKLHRRQEGFSVPHMRTFHILPKLHGRSAPSRCRLVTPEANSISHEASFGDTASPQRSTGNSPTSGSEERKRPASSMGTESENLLPPPGGISEIGTHRTHLRRAAMKLYRTAQKGTINQSTTSTPGRQSNGSADESKLLFVSSDNTGTGSTTPGGNGKPKAKNPNPQQRRSVSSFGP